MKGTGKETAGNRQRNHHLGAGGLSWEPGGTDLRLGLG
jgi:hypothetical protein